MWYVEQLIENLPLTPEQSEMVYDYGDCLYNGREMAGDAFETEMDSFILENFGIKVPTNQLGWG